MNLVHFFDANVLDTETIELDSRGVKEKSMPYLPVLHYVFVVA
jgi:hypothetical protein